MSTFPKHDWERRAAHVRNIRAKLGCGLREAADFYDRNPHNVDERLAETIKGLAGGTYYVSPEQRVRDALTHYQTNLNLHGDNANAHETLVEIASILNHPPLVKEQAS